MSNPFGTSDMAAGYAFARPPVHPRIVEMLQASLQRKQPFLCALDVGCGAGISTRALEGFAEQRIGLEPAAIMLRTAGEVAPGALFLAATAESIPFRDNSVDLMTAAGSLNYADLNAFFPEAARVLGPDGVLAVYDFQAGSSLRDSAELDHWFAEFQRRYPPPANEARKLDPQILEPIASGFRLIAAQHFVTGVPLTRDFYIGYMLTETNVAAAIRSGVPSEEIRCWCAESLPPWQDKREVLFRGYYACFTPDART